MHKKLIMACMAIAAFAAFVVAPAASASPALTENGSLVAVGSSIVGKNTGVTKFVGGSILTVECSTAILEGTVTSNTGETIKGEVPIGKATFGGTGPADSPAEPECTSNVGNTTVTVTSKLCLHASGDIVTVTGCGGNVTFTLNVTGWSECKYSTASVTGTLITNADATVNLSEQPASLVSGAFCPPSGKLSMDFDLTTTGGTTLLIS